MKPQVRELESVFMKTNIPEFGAGDTLQISFRVREGEKERIQIFQGVVIQIRGSGMSKSVTVRKMSGNVAVERVFPLHSPNVSEIKLIRSGDVRRARIYYLRDLQGKAARIKEVKAGLEAGALAGADPVPAKAEPAAAIA